MYVYIYIYIGLTLNCSLAVDRMRGSLLQVSFAPKQVHVTDCHICMYVYMCIYIFDLYISG